jgi:hypothetical protein
MNCFKRIKKEKKMKREIGERNSRVETTRTWHAHQRSNQQKQKNVIYDLERVIVKGRREEWWVRKRGQCEEVP